MARSSPFDGLVLSEVLGSVARHEGVRLLHNVAGPVLDRAYATDPAGTGSLGDIEHIVLLMQENRSFDHYFGTMSGVRGFDDPSPAYRQPGYEPGVGPSETGFLNPFRLDSTRGPSLDGDAINDPTHAWGPQHEAWHGGAMDGWVRAHLKANGPVNGPATMGYYTREDIPVHYAIADAFTICDNYHCSVLGPTDPNRMFWISGTMDPEGKHGGPLLTTPDDPKPNIYSWPTYPEALEAAGVSWKVYESKTVEILAKRFLSGLLFQFKSFAADDKSPLARKGLDPSYPHDFRNDVKNNTLPAVSWVVPSLLTCEHPALPPAFGAVGLIEVLDILTSNPAVWEKTALIVSYDENGGFFDHVPPPTAPPGTPGEYVTASLDGVVDADGIRGPIGLGFRVPGLVISPYSRGGLVASDVFDHTSQLRLIERRFGVEVPNVSAWRRETVGDMVSAFDFADTPEYQRPKLPNPDRGALQALIEGNINILLGFLGKGRSYPVPPNQMPTQDQSPKRGRPTQAVAQQAQ